MRRPIPDEIIHEILSPALSVSDDTFSARFLNSAPVPCLESSSAILLVCKAWLRVATPLLYHTVILGSKGQAQALSVALRSNQDLGRLVKKLRVESGYGTLMHKILQATKNLTDIFIPLEFDKGENACGLCRGLQLIDPVRVIITYDPFKATTPKLVRDLVGVLIEYIPKWKNLAIFEMPHESTDDIDSSHNETFALPLKVAPNLRTLVLSWNQRDLFWEGAIPPYISRIIRNPSLQEIRPKARSRKVLAPDFLETVQQSAKLQALVDPNLFGPTRAFVYPSQLAAKPTVADAIWDHSDDNSERDEMPTLCGPLLRLGTPHFYKNIYITTCESMRLFTRRLLLQPSLGAHVRRLFICRHDEKTLNDLQNIFSRVPRMAEFSSAGTLILPWPMFDELTHRYGPYLDSFRGVTVTRCPHRVDPTIFYRLSKIQDFTWKSDTEFHTTINSFAARNALDNLKELTVSLAHPSFFAVLSQMHLPSLSTVVLCTVGVDTRLFFKKHGKKLSKLFVGALAFDVGLFNFCPNVKVLDVCTASEDKLSLLQAVLKRCETHGFLERIVIEPIPSDREGQSELLEDFLFEFDRTPFPALQEVQHSLFDWRVPT
ncbi:hypothetical protein FB45DRAFT_1091487 [Roridomyces roridus]|uniref:Uncharacterized protein n=1 Tax=Roridomyces roridus TaxID=1738132 RepID=A0AAD7FGD6_9AGAR|nr:hypothetical protein FB45DRAFT_1091487 [Roridomyces roridus]